jgi:hypothetical protein
MLIMSAWAVEKMNTLSLRKKTFWSFYSFWKSMWRKKIRPKIIIASLSVNLGAFVNTNGTAFSEYEGKKDKILRDNK